MANSSFETLPDDLQMMILSSLPLKSLVRCLSVSKKWESLIRSKTFRAVYLDRSMTRPRVLFLVRRIASLPPEPNMMWFHSVYQKQSLLPGPPDTELLFHSVYREEKPLLSSGQQQMRIPLDTTFNMSISQPIRGLICLQLGTQFAICNPGTKMFKILPEIHAHKDAVVKSFLGYDDEVTNVFKVLCVTVLWETEQSERVYDFQVLTVGSGEECSSWRWRQIACKEDHTPETEGLCKGGVLYYGARSTSNEDLIMRFDVSSEEFTVIENIDRRINSYWKFVIYNGAIALVNDSDFLLAMMNERNGDKVFHIRVLDSSSLIFIYAK